MEEKDNKKKKLIVRIIAIIILLLLLLLSLNRCGYIRFPWESDRMIVGNIKQGNLPGLTDEELLAELQRQADESRVTVQLNSQPLFENGKSEGSLYLANPEVNKYDMHVEIKLEETNELLYDSGIIPPGYYIDYDKLLVELNEGTHSAIAKVTYYEDDVVKTKTEFKINIIIQS